MLHSAKAKQVEPGHRLSKLLSDAQTCLRCDSTMFVLMGI